MLSQLSPRELVCLERIEETHDVATFAFDGRDFDYKPGQFTTVETEVNGKVLQRAYTVSSSPSRPERLTVTIKRVEDGVVSNHLLDTLYKGGSLRLSNPAGKFNLLDCAGSDDYLFVSAGSGITPMMSMTRYLQDNRLPGNIHFIHFARSADDLIFAEELQQLAKQHHDFKLDIVLSQKADPRYHFGLLDQALFEQLVPSLERKAVFTCGPAPFMALLEHCLQHRNFDMSLFHQESFGSVPAAPEQPLNSEAVHSVSVPSFNKSTEVTQGTTVLEAAEDIEIPILAACRSGVCGSCKCKVKGSVTSTSQVGLSAEEIEQGFVLACSSTINSDIELSLK
ncbi:hybrid-cluster NAD(P)-dependent oxidoreductase [Paraferrimonas haliotis]|uniref:Hybrid-cluster NAD(P)-dependent oxidoreductase n=1 Tax=Paraferrimonas haliotis TaxID=2013866 RepID=A0AA37TTY9_9GAMM|nr:hybrid-cluster NAD(P)-dependent oxidoreductase [Paraferrimonas haliotis]GLS82675.1 hybrid-cluster NAD(P)-dependent oxidoreductase [Paraferrimonas haliotis]